MMLNNAKAYFREEIVDCSLAINDGRILKIGKEATMPKAAERINLENLLVLPGLIDSHVHLRDEGKAYKESFLSGTAAAAAGGFTTVLDMPNNDPVTMSAGTLRNRMKTAEAKVFVNVAFYSEFPRSMKEIEEIVAEGPIAFKLFMAEQVGGLDIDDDRSMLEAFKILGELEVLVAVHAEDHAKLRSAKDRLRGTNLKGIDAFLEVHSESIEVAAVERVLNISKQAGAHAHFCHVSTEMGLKAICNAKKSGTLVTCEVTPHHLLLSTEDLRRIGSTAITMPPAREKHQIATLWKGVGSGCVDTIGSDHAPHTLDEKRAREIWDVKVGIPGMETTLPLLLTELRHGRLSIADIVRLMSENPARIFRLEGRGSLAEGSNADLTVIDLKRRHRIDASRFLSKAKYSPFDGWQVEGKAVKTFVGGHQIMDEGEIVAKAGSGKIIRRE